MSSTIELVEYNDQYYTPLTDFTLPDEQLTFTSLPLHKMDDPNLSKDTKHILIVEQGKPVGYFALEYGEKLFRYSDNQGARLLTSFSIDSRYQGKGLAKQGLRLLPEFMKNHFPETEEVVLGVNQKNKAALNLYLKTGFVDNQEIYEGRKGPQHILHLDVS